MYWKHFYLCCVQGIGALIGLPCWNKAEYMCYRHIDIILTYLQADADKSPFVAKTELSNPNQCKHSKTQYVDISQNSMATSLHQTAWLNPDDIRELEAEWEFESVSLLCQRLQREKKILCEWCGRGPQLFLHMHQVKHIRQAGKQRRGLQQGRLYQWSTERLP